MKPEYKYLMRTTYRVALPHGMLIIKRRRPLGKAGSVRKKAVSFAFFRSFCAFFAAKPRKTGLSAPIFSRLRRKKIPLLSLAPQ
jgi:hypothetical protein